MIVLVTGAAGFIGRHVCRRLARRGDTVLGLDNFSRPFARAPERCAEFYRADVRDLDRLILPRVDAIVHLAAQTTVTRSLTSPRADFEANAAGSAAVAWWALRQCGGPVVYASTNKVFGEGPFGDVVYDAQPLAPCTPYGVTKAFGAMYLRDLLPGAAVVFHQSCIYGPDQPATEDQGWVSWLIECAARGRGVTCYGDGSQVRDLLYVEDLVTLYERALDGAVPPGSYVVGGGADNARTFVEVAALVGARVIAYAPWREHDQRRFVSANSGLARVWSPVIPATAGVLSLAPPPRR